MNGAPPRPPRPHGGAAGRAVRYVPGPQAPTRHSRRGGVGTVRVGERLVVQFTSVDPLGRGVARLGAVHLAVPFVLPGEEAVVQVVRGGRHAEGRLVKLLRKVAGAQPPRCRHFGVCGGCQWQHVPLEVQRRLKTRMVKDYLKEHADVRRDLVLEAVGGEGWAYRNTLRATFAPDGADGVRLGFHAAGSPEVLDVAHCPIQHPANEAVLAAARETVAALRLPVYDPVRRTGLVRGLLAVASHATGEVVAALSTAAPLDRPTDLVHALRERAPALVGLLVTVQPRPTTELVGPRLRLLWGRPVVEEEAAGFRLRLGPAPALPAHPRALAHLARAVVRAAALDASRTAVDVTAQTPLLTLALASAGQAAGGIVPTRRALDDARAAAQANGVTNVEFALPPGRQLLAPPAPRPWAIVATAEGQGLDDDLLDRIVAARPERIVHVARSLAACARDLARWRRKGYAPESVQPLDLLPQTSHVHLVVALRAVRQPR